MEKVWKLCPLLIFVDISCRGGTLKECKQDVKYIYIERAGSVKELLTVELQVLSSCVDSVCSRFVYNYFIIERALTVSTL